MGSYGHDVIISNKIFKKVFKQFFKLKNRKKQKFMIKKITNKFIKIL